AYADLGPLGRMSRAEFLTRSLLSTQKGLQGRLDAAAVAQQNLQHAADEISISALYGIDLSSLQARITHDRELFANALTVAAFDAISVDAKDVTANADHATYVAMAKTHIASAVTFTSQNTPLTSERAATSMALPPQGIY